MPKEYNARGERMYENPINRENAKKNKKNKTNTMKNTETSTSECIKADVLHKKILWRLNILERQISECKKGFTRFYTQAHEKPNVSVGENDISWVEAFNDFVESWKEIGAEKYEVECLVNLMYDLVLQEEVKYKGKIVLNTKRRATSMVK